MKLKTNSTIAVIVLFAVLSLSPNSAYSQTQAQESITAHNGDDNQRSAIDLEFTFQVLEEDKDETYITSYSIATSVNIGTPTVTATGYNDDGNIWRYKASYSDIDVDYCSSVTITVTVFLDDAQGYYNLIEIVDLSWSYSEFPFVLPAIPDHGFYYPDDQYEVFVTDHNTTYIFVNTDTDVTVTLNYLHFYLSTASCNPGDWDCARSGTLIEELIGPLEVPPDSSYIVRLTGIPNSNRFIYVAGEMEYQMPNFDYEITTFLQGHEERRPIAIPSIIEWGIILLALLLVMVGVIVIRRQRAIQT
ncbi:MAG: hypothetical protein JSV33_02155 [bacterium]|nr:MAG: hypothetical protein JSV33_02155 [bacterium]